ncbi:hypothetical protein B0H13DRAFT_1990013 [Mycena leptocephala]|nr:hypothetical protein B0H13DRAFT_1990013 [Mycena leptocephala]
MAIHLPAQRSPPQCTRPSGLFALPVLSILPRRPYSTTPPLLSQNAFCAERPSIGWYCIVCRRPRPRPRPRGPDPSPGHFIDFILLIVPKFYGLASSCLSHSFQMKDASAGNHSYLSLIDATSATNTFPFSPQTSRLGIVAVCRPGARRRPTSDVPGHTSP